MNDEKFANPNENEDVEKTINEIKKIRKERGIPPFRRALKKASEPLVKIGKKLATATSSITIRTTVIHFLILLIVLTILSAIVLSVVSSYLNVVKPDNYDEFINSLYLLIILSDFVLLALSTILVYFSARFTLSPIRGMVKKIKTVTSENLGERIDVEGSATELKELGVRINELLENIDGVYSRQKKFISDASHELKTPISVIQGYASLLLRWGKNDESVLAESIESIAREAENMKNLVERLLFLARIGKYVLNKENVKIKELLFRIKNGYDATGCDRNIVVNGEEVTVFTDSALLTECIRALVDNAIKYSPANSDLILSTSKKQGKVCIISVKDFGIGISEENILKIFDRFFRCDNVRNREGSSTGLGLTICKTAIETLGGKIGVISKIGEGSEFIIELGEENENGNAL